jgi:ankyrin repeat protein
MSAQATTKSDTAAAKTVETDFKPIPEGLGRKGTTFNDIPAAAERLKGARVTQLHLAVEEGNVDRVEQLLSKDKSELDLQDPDGMTALVIAAKNKNTDVVRVLLRWEPKMDVADKAGRTALHWAAQNGDAGIIEQLLSAGDSAKTSATTSTGFDTGGKVQGGSESRSIVSGGRGIGGLASGGLASGDQVRGGDARGGDARGGDARGGEWSGGQARGGNARGGEWSGLLASGGLASGGLASGGLASGGLASEGQGIGGVASRILVRGGDARGGQVTANVDLLDSESRTPLYLASESGSVDAVRLLLERGADDRLRDKRGRVPLQAAAVAGKKEVTGLLSGSGATGSGSKGRSRSYFLFPNFDTPPPPYGPLDLGAFIVDPREMQPLSPRNTIPPRPEWISRRLVSGFRTTLAQTETGQYGLWVKMLGRSISANLSPEKDVTEVIEVGTLEDISFVPPSDYLEDCMAAIGGVSSRVWPVYMVTGMKIARDASCTRSSATTIDAGSEVAGVGVSASASKSVNASVNVKQLLRESFILAVSLSKLDYKRSILSRKPTELRISSYTRGALF